MKSFLTACLVLVSVFVFAQEPQPKDNTIVVQTQDSAKVVYLKMKKILLEEQYSITSSDDQLMTITAKGQIDRQADMTVSVYVGEAYPSKVRFFGSWDGHSANTTRSTVNSNTKQLTAQIEYRKMGGSWIKDSWKKMVDLAKLLPNGSLTYLQK